MSNFKVGQTVTVKPGRETIVPKMFPYLSKGHVNVIIDTRLSCKGRQQLMFNYNGLNAWCCAERFILCKNRKPNGERYA